MTQTDIEAWRDPARTAGERVADLLRRMTLEEKIAQLGSIWMGASGDGDGVAPMQDQFFDLTTSRRSRSWSRTGSASLPGSSAPARSKRRAE